MSSLSPVTTPSSFGVGTRSPSVPPVTQKNLKARLQRTCESARVRKSKVAGKIEWLHPDFEEGRRFETWMVLARLKSVDYRADVARAEASLALARKNLAQLEFQTKLEKTRGRRP